MAKKLICPKYPNFVSILGTIWRIEIRSEKIDPVFEKDKTCDGYCEYDERLIVVKDITLDPDYQYVSQSGMSNKMNSILRHEIVHAYFDECGLQASAGSYRGAWPKNEEMVDWISSMADKIYKTWEECNCIYHMDPEIWTKWQNQEKENKDVRKHAG